MVTRSVKPAFPVGVYACYELYCQCVKDDNVKWTGRGKIPFAKGCESLSFLSPVEAENHYRHEAGDSSGTVPYFY